MKILHVLYSGLGGHANVFFSLIDADKDHEFEYAALFNGIENVREEYLQKCKENNIESFYVSKKRGFDLTYYRKLYKIIKENNPDIIFLHSGAYILPAKLAAWNSKTKKKIIVRETQANHLKTKMDSFWLSIALSFADEIVFLTEEYKNEVRKRFRLIFPEKKISVIPNGINLEVFHPAPKTSPGGINIGMQSRIVKIKDHLTLLRSFALLKKDEGIVNKTLVLKIAGEGDLLLALKLYAEELGISGAVEFTGYLSEEKLSTFLQSLNIYVHASLGETMSTAIMQAMACGLPIVASDVKGINNMLENNYTGILVPSVNEFELAKAIKIIATDDQLSNKLAFNALETAKKKFSNTAMFHNYKNLFKN